MGKVFNKNVLLWPLPQIADALKPPDIKPSPPPEAPTILTEPSSSAQTAEKRKKSGRLSTQVRVPGALDDASIYKPTLLGS